MNFKSGLFFKGLIIGTLCLVIFLFVTRQAGIKPPLISRDSQAFAAKKKAWEDMEKKVASWGDALGMGIDPQIKKMVIILNLLDFKTMQSCEGHMDWGLPYPWVRMTTETPKIEKLIQERNSTWALRDKKHEEIAKKHPDLSFGDALRKEESQELNDIYKKSHKLNDAVEKALISGIEPLHALLEEFYADRKIDPDAMLIINPQAVRDLFELSSVGGVWQIARSDAEKRKKLQDYQREMNEFADFLTQRYFSKS